MPLGAFRLNSLARYVAATSSRDALSVTAYGNAQVDTAQSKFGGASAYFDGTGDYLIGTGVTLSNSDDFTWECWYRHSSLPASSDRYTLGFCGGYIQINNLGSGNIDYSVATENDSGGMYYERFNLNSTTDNVWHHVAFVKNGTNLYCFQNGTACSSAATSGTHTSSHGWQGTESNEYIGRLGASSTYDMSGWIDEVRLSNTARYTSNFTPSASAFTNDENTVYLLHMDGSDGSTTFVDDNS